jgi:hypothetical protein
LLLIINLNKTCRFDCRHQINHELLDYEQVNHAAFSAPQGRAQDTKLTQGKAVFEGKFWFTSA